MKLFLFSLFLLFNSVSSSYTTIPDPNTETSIYFVLPQSNLDYLEDLAYNISNPTHPNYGNYLSKEEIYNIISPSKTINNKIKEWFYEESLEANCTDYIDMIHCRMPIREMDNLFTTKIKHYRGENSYLYAETPLHFPRWIEEDTDFILYPSRPIHKKLSAKVSKPTSNNYDEYYVTPYGLGRMYNMSEDVLYNNNSTQAVVEFENDPCFNINDLNNFMKINNLPSVQIEQDHIIGQCNDTSWNVDIEATLDIQYQYGNNVMGAQYYVSVSQWMYAFATEMFAMDNPPLVYSMSWGWAEHEQCDPYVFPSCAISVPSEEYTKRTNIEFMKLSLRGVTLVASSGDSGAPGRSNGQCMGSPHLNPVFPTDSPWVTSVGGTYSSAPIGLNQSLENIPPICKNYTCLIGGNETNCNYDRTHWTSGGGISNYFSRPWWQINQTDAYFNSSVPLPASSDYNRYGRMYPDVTLLAHNYIIIVDDSILFVDGTSCSSPTFSAMISRWNNLRIEQNKPPLGAFNALLYHISEECPECFRDYTEGNINSTEYGNCKYGYTASVGYDPVYGLGTPNYGRIYEFLRMMD